MKLPDIIIAIDGYSSTGKSTLAKLIAEHFSFLYLEIILWITVSSTYTPKANPCLAQP